MATIKWHLITCPHCGSSSSYQMALGNGVTHYVSCRSCYKRIGIQTNMDTSIYRIRRA